MNPYHADIETLTADNANFRKVEWTGTHLQVVLMSLKPGEEIGAEIHTTVDQFFRFEAGTGVVEIESKRHEVSDGFAVVVPAGAHHNVMNTGDTDLKLYTIYAPANHPEGLVHVTKAEADEYEAAHHHEE